MSRHKSGYFDGILWLFRGIWKFVKGVGTGMYMVAKYFVQAIDKLLQEDKRW